MSKLIKNNLFSLIAAIIVTYMSLANSSTFDDVGLLKLPDFDKVVHIAMYFFLTITILLEHRFVLKTKKSIIVAVLIPSAYGILMELFQLLTVTRSGDVLDAIADIVGVALALIFYMIAGSRLKQIR